MSGTSGMQTNPDSPAGRMLRELSPFIEARLDERERWARSASRAGTASDITGGAHWRWVDFEGNTLEPGRLNEHQWWEAANLETVERLEATTGERLPALLFTAEEIGGATAALIVLHDPASVLRRVDADRQLLRHLRQLAVLSWSGLYSVRNEAIRAMRAMAAVFAEHPDFEAAWLEWDE